jgi:LacI family transcriptional regulator
VCGFDDTAMATTIWPELTTIRQPVFDMSRRAVELLVQEIRRRNAGAVLAQEPHAVIGYSLIRRQSDGSPARSRKAGVNDDGDVRGDTTPVLGMAVS